MYRTIIQAVDIKMSKTEAANSLKQEVALRDLRFYAYHGFYPEEQVLGHEFFVDVQVCFQISDEEFPESQEELDRTVNYEILYRLIKEEMEMPRKLLETVCYDIFDRIKLNFNFLDEIQVKIRKTNPPFGGDSATATVAMNWKKQP